MFNKTPNPQPAKIVGNLDMIRASTRTFALKLPDGEEIRAVLTEGDIAVLTPFFRKDVLVVGKAIFRPSGRVLRVEAVNVQLSTKQDVFFAKPPKPRLRSITKTDLLHEKNRKRSAGWTFGKWPGNETDEEVEKALQELS